jgi:hypothetical protein
LPYKQEPASRSKQNPNKKTKEAGQKRAVFHGAEMGGSNVKKGQKKKEPKNGNKKTNAFGENWLVEQGNENCHGKQILQATAHARGKSRHLNETKSNQKSPNSKRNFHR